MQISLHSPTGKRLLCVGGVSYFNAWRCLKERIAAEHRIHEADMDEAIRIEEGDDGLERATVDGTFMGYVITTIGGIEFGKPDAFLTIVANENTSDLSARIASIGDTLDQVDAVLRDVKRVLREV
jgi:hypothetical protein